MRTQNKFKKLAASRRLDNFKALAAMAEVFVIEQMDKARAENHWRSHVMANRDTAPAHVDVKHVTYVRPIAKFVRYETIFDRILNEEISVPKFLKDSQGRPPGYEMFEFEDKSSNFNADLPDNLSFVAQGTAQERTPWLNNKIRETRRTAWGEIKTNRRSMNAADFRERCVQHYGRNHVLYMKTKADCQGAQHARPEWLAEELKIDMIDATSLAEVFRRLSIDRTRALQILNGYMTDLTDSPRMTSGLKNVAAESISETILQLEQIAEKLPELGDDPETLDDYRELYRQIAEGGSFDDWWDRMEWIEESAREAYDFAYDEPHPLDVHRLIQCGFNVEEPEPDVQTEWWGQTLKYVPFNSNPYSAFALHHGEDNIDYEMILEIKTAKIEKDDPSDRKEPDSLREIQQRAFAQPTQYGWRRPELSYLNNSQMSQFWRYVNERKQKLGDEFRHKMSAPARNVLKMVIELKGRPVSKALIMAYKNGSMFETDYELIDFGEMPRPSKEELYALWAEYRKLAA